MKQRNITMSRHLLIASVMLATSALSAGALAQQAPDKCNVAADAAANARRTVKPLVLAFYYPWYGSADGPAGRWVHWRGVEPDKKQIANSTHYPALGAYDSHDQNVIEQHCQWARAAGIDGFIVSWWGHGTFEDRAMPMILDACAKHGMAVTAYHEQVPRPVSPESAARDIDALLRKYAGHDAWLKVEGKPVVFVYVRSVNQLGVNGWKQAADLIRQNHPGGVALVGDQFSAAAANVFDGLHTYNTAGALKGKEADDARRWAHRTFPKWVDLAASQSRISTLTVIPGYDDRKERPTGFAVPRYDGATYRTQWEEAIAARPDWILVTTFNEWHEGSEIEPSSEHGSQYLDATAGFAKQFKASRAAGGQ